MNKKFDTRQSLKELQRILERYNTESLELYSEECYIKDILFFLGKSIDADKYGYDAVTYRRFIAQKIAPFSGEVAKEVFITILKRGK